MNSRTNRGAARAALAWAACAAVGVAGASCGPKSGDFYAGWHRWKKMTAAPFLSEGHVAGKFLVDVYVNDVGAAAYAAKKGPYPVGTVIIKKHFHDEGGKPGHAALLTSMEKKAPGYDSENGDWEYAKASPDGKVELRGKEPICVTCHTTADSDYVFARTEPSK